MEIQFQYQTKQPLRLDVCKHINMQILTGVNRSKNKDMLYCKKTLTNSMQAPLNLMVHM